MAIYRFTANGTFSRRESRRLTAAYEAALLDLGLVDGDDPITQTIAKVIVEIARRGTRDPAIIKDRALKIVRAAKFDAEAPSAALIA